MLGMLSRHHMPRLTSRLDDNTRARLEPLKLRDLVCSSEGEAVAAQLISVLVTEHLTATGQGFLPRNLENSCQMRDLRRATVLQGSSRGMMLPALRDCHWYCRLCVLTSSKFSSLFREVKLQILGNDLTEAPWPAQH